MTEPMAAAYGSVAYRRVTMVQIASDIGRGWGECVALNEPTYSAEWAEGEFALLKEVLAPLFLRSGEVRSDNLATLFEPYKQHHTAKCALEMAVLDAELRATNTSFASYLGATADAVECSFVASLVDGDQLLRSVQEALDAGYRVIKLKIRPGADLKRIDLLQSVFPQLLLRVDANASYVWENPDHRRALLEMDTRGLALIEQPFHPDRWLPFREYKAHMKTLVAMDETLTSYTRVLNVMELAFCDVLIIKPGMLGGYLVAKKIQAEAQERGIATMVGGMIDTGLSRNANIALAASSTCNAEYPAELSPDGRWFNDRLNATPVEMVDGLMPVSKDAGVVGQVDWNTVDRLTSRLHIVHR
jgi:O-succinylbenzoate synthase